MNKIDAVRGRLADARDQLAGAVDATLRRAFDTPDDPAGRAHAGDAAEHAANLVEELTGRDRTLAAAAAAGVLEWCWTVGAADAPLEPDPAWWATPLGQLTAAALPDDDTVTVRVADAVAMLDLTPSRVQQLIGDGRVRRAGRGRVVRGDVVRYLRERERR